MAKKMTEGEGEGIGGDVGGKGGEVGGGVVGEDEGVVGEVGELKQTVMDREFGGEGVWGGLMCG
ncbi:hypothetical protein, partial [Corynebacterium glyciniphilum]|uniref:hypothetical protein n=1 Tax=Corynebacterium glyciniphilum TaxID=1404244 RepID=UPI001C92DBCB